ncbi:MAG: heavy metal translocating P-type ATPase [Chloroflexi bacterium]|nr:heavy metal translocating P-type ATPase [Chloroflexota bacterium]
MMEHRPGPAPGNPGRHAGVHEGHRIEDFRRRFWVCLLLTLPVLAYSELIQSFLAGLGLVVPSIPGSALIPPVFSSIIFFYGGSVFIRGAANELKSHAPGMMTLVSLAIVTAYVYSVAAELVQVGGPLYWELSTLVDVMLLGHWLELRAIRGARGALAELAKLLPDTAELLAGEQVRTVPLAQLQVGDRVLVRPGGKIPVDGLVNEGASDVSEAMISGESRPVAKTSGAKVIAGTVNGAGSLRVEVTNIGEDTALAGIMRLVEQAQQSRSAAQAIADRAAYWLTLIAIGTGAITLAAWVLLAAPAGFALERAVTVLVIACPHALGLAIPLVISISTTVAARNGLLVRDRLALEQARDVDVVVFDKTGTLTRGEQGVVGIATSDELGEDQALAIAAAVEGDSEHIIARAIRAEAERRGMRRPPITEFKALPGRGVSGRVDGQAVEVGGPRLLELLDQSLPERLQVMSRQWGEEGKTVAYLVVDGKPAAAIALADVIREESREAVARLKRMGIDVAMLTGDSEEVARWVARELGIREYFAEVLPEHKSDKVRELRRRGRRVAMVGDGINDAPALLTADVGVAIGAGTDVAIESAGIILVRNDPRDVVKIVELSRASYGKMVQNLFWATGYNVVAIPLAAGILAPWGIVLVPAVGALLMSVSTIVVAINAQLLRRLNLHAA